MAHGNMLLGQVRGSVGDVTFNVLKGQQVSRARNRQPANPKTMLQQAQRSLLANMTKYYKRATKNFYKFAFEDKLRRESDYNAFARHNIMEGAFITKENYDNSAWPALGEFMISNGSLGKQWAQAYQGDYFVFLSTQAANGATADNTTIGTLSTAIITEIANAIEGDIFTIIVASSSLSPDQRVGALDPTWQIIQFYLDPANTDTLASKGISISNRLYCVETEGVVNCAIGAAILSRQTENGLLVSETYVKQSIATAALTDWLKGEYARQQAAVSWGGNPDAILAGGELPKLPNITGVTQSGTDNFAWIYGLFTGIDEASGPVLNTINVRGSNLKTTAQGGVWTAKLYFDSTAANNPSWSYVGEVTLTATGTADNIALASPSRTAINFHEGDQGYVVLYYNGVPYSYGAYLRA